ncbi:putative disease resistance protein [Camellia lanceoleosa]|uniref:Disease resistance protein n=1 Tax=Camellia lanceoleosa TaxID=1840588 RepID=A0ACC0GPG2_9ERIC|nr:putative disease resistance protein [Camellia lanceoleosa]
MDEIPKMISTVGNSPHSSGKDQKVISLGRALSQGRMKLEVKLLKQRANKHNRRKDLLHLLLSYPMKSATDQADLFLLRDNFIKLNRMIKRLDAAATMEENVTHNTNLVELIETDIPAVLEDVDRCLAKYDFDILYYASLKLAGITVQAERYELISRVERYNFAIRQILQCVNKGSTRLEIPEHGSVVLTSRTMDIYQIMPVDLEIKMEDLLLPWTLFWNNVNNIPATIIELMALHLIKACHNHLLAIILLARALKSVTDVGVWKLAFLELMSSSNLSSPVEGTSEVMVHVLKFVWQCKCIVRKHCIKHLCTSVTKVIELKISSLVSCWIDNDLIKTKTAGKHVLKDLIKSFLLEKVNKGYVRMREETRDVLLKHFIPHLHPLYLKQEDLGLSEAPEVAEWDAKEIYLNNNHLSELPEKPNCPSLVTLFLQKNYNLMEIPTSFLSVCPCSEC